MYDVTDKDPKKQIKEWFFCLHKLKKEKVSLDREIFLAFDGAAESQKPSIQKHLKISRTQLLSLVNRAKNIYKWRAIDSQKIVNVLFDGTVLYHHPKLVTMHFESLKSKDLELILDVLLDGLDI